MSAGTKFAHYNASNAGTGGVKNDADKLWLWSLTYQSGLLIFSA